MYTYNNKKESDMAQNNNNPNKVTKAQLVFRSVVGGLCLGAVAMVFLLMHQCSENNRLVNEKEADNKDYSDLVEDYEKLQKENKQKQDSLTKVITDLRSANQDCKNIADALNRKIVVIDSTNNAKLKEFGDSIATIRKKLDDCGGKNGGTGNSTARKSGGSPSVKKPGNSGTPANTRKPGNTGTPVAPKTVGKTAPGGSAGSAGNMTVNVNSGAIGQFGNTIVNNFNGGGNQVPSNTKANDSIIINNYNCGGSQNHEPSQSPTPVRDTFYLKSTTVKRPRAVYVTPATTIIERHGKNR
jgi:hypothetical protein